MLMVISCVVLIPGAMTLPTISIDVPVDLTSDNEVHTYDFLFETRAQWLAREPLQITPLHTPVPYVVIHHSYTPPACYTDAECQRAMRSMQDFHMDIRGWWDIGYNFAVGGNGVAYEGRGWERLGAHALHFNTVSIGICLIGNWTDELPSSEQIKTAKLLIAAGVELGYIKQDYKLVGHRQVRDTSCPGESLYENIQHWEHYSNYPASAEDLKDLKELTDHFAMLHKTNDTIVTDFEKHIGYFFSRNSCGNSETNAGSWWTAGNGANETTILGLPSKNEATAYSFPFVSREDWQAREPTHISYIREPAPYVVIHHTYIPAACHVDAECVSSMRGMQTSHMDHNGWNDIGYNFAIGGDNATVYEGRGWGVVGAHAVGFNTIGVGISFIGDYRFETPPAAQLELAKKLIDTGVLLGYIAEDYKLIGHRQASATECPGDALFQYIQEWNHFYHI